MCRLLKPSSQTRILNRLSIEAPEPSLASRVSDPKDKTVHMKCAVSQNVVAKRILDSLQSQSQRSPSHAPSPGRSVTRARRFYVNRLANFRSSDRPTIRDSAQGRALPPLRQDDKRTSLSPHCYSLRLLLQCGLAHLAR